MSNWVICERNERGQVIQIMDPVETSEVNADTAISNYADSYIATDPYPNDILTKRTASGYVFVDREWVQTRTSEMDGTLDSLWDTIVTRKYPVRKYEWVLKN